MQRSHRRLKDALAQRTEPGDPDYPPLDAFYHFCCDALHFRDWISSDLHEHASAAVEAINQHTALSICSDVAIGGKHRIMRQTARTPGGPSTAERVGVTIMAPLAGSDSVGWTQYTVHVDAGDHGTLDASQVADDAIAAWDAWLTAREIAVPSA